MPRINIKRGQAVDYKGHKAKVIYETINKVYISYIDNYKEIRLHVNQNQLKVWKTTI